MAVKKSNVNRKAEDCFMEAATKMTDKERINVIKYFQENFDTFQERYNGLKENTEGAFKLARQREQEFEQLNIQARAKINILKSNIQMLYQNAQLIQKWRINND